MWYLLRHLLLNSGHRSLRNHLAVPLVDSDRHLAQSCTTDTTGQKGRFQWPLELSFPSFLCEPLQQGRCTWSAQPAGGRVFQALRPGPTLAHRATSTTLIRKEKGLGKRAVWEVRAWESVGILVEILEALKLWEMWGLLANLWWVKRYECSQNWFPLELRNELDGFFHFSASHVPQTLTSLNSAHPTVPFWMDMFPSTSEEMRPLHLHAWLG